MSAETDPVDAADWATIWQSELAAMAVDRECQEQAAAAGRAWIAASDAAAGRPGPDAAARPPAAGAAPEFERAWADLLHHAVRAGPGA